MGIARLLFRMLLETRQGRTKLRMPGWDRETYHFACGDDSDSVGTTGAAQMW